MHSPELLSFQLEMAGEGARTQGLHTKHFYVQAPPSF